VIAFGSAVTKPEVYRRCAQPGIERAAEPDSEIFDFASIGSLQASYNAVIDEAATREDLEALVLVHQDAEIVDADFCAKIREVLRDPDVGIIGCVGAIGVRSIAWWEGSVTLASFIHRYDEHGGGDLPAFSWAWDEAPPYARLGEVDTLDGFLLVLSPWAVQNIRFDESLGSLHGYDFDYCLQVRAAGRKVMTADVRAIHNHALVPFSDPHNWIAAHIMVAEKWEGRIPEVGAGAGTWKERALRAEAERDAAWAVDHANVLHRRARVAEAEHALAETVGSISWRLTSPLRLFERSRPQARRIRRRRPLRSDLASAEAETGLVE
jgi:glycosyl transferase family 2